MKYYCDECGSTETYVKDYIHNYGRDGKPITFTAKRRFCKKCSFYHRTSSDLRI